MLCYDELYILLIIRKNRSFLRQFYNDVVMEYNNMIQAFPTNLIAQLFGFKEAVFFSIEDGEDENIRIKF
ncbi:MAG: LemA protein [Clostridiales bacterium]|nr:LemA protein [Clostridiales bacterium]